MIKTIYYIDGKQVDGSLARIDKDFCGETITLEFENGDPTIYSKIRRTYKNGLTHGTVSAFYKSGQMKYEDEYRNGMGHGLVRDWDPDGSLISVSYYLHGSESTKEAYEENELIEQLAGIQCL